MSDKGFDRDEKLRLLIRNSDYKGLQEYVEYLESIQKTLLQFDHPSLVLLAVEVYFDPSCLIDSEYKFEIILFLLKCGLYLFVPKGEVILHLFELAHKWGVSDDKMYKVVVTLVTWGKTEIFQFDRFDIFDSFRGTSVPLTPILFNHSDNNGQILSEEVESTKELDMVLSEICSTYPKTIAYLKNYSKF